MLSYNETERSNGATNVETKKSSDETLIELTSQSIVWQCCIRSSGDCVEQAGWWGVSTVGHRPASWIGTQWYLLWFIWTLAKYTLHWPQTRWVIVIQTLIVLAVILEGLPFIKLFPPPQATHYFIPHLFPSCKHIFVSLLFKSINATIDQSFGTLQTMAPLKWYTNTTVHWTPAEPLPLHPSETALL